jgi:hypothetical protein
MLSKQQAETVAAEVVREEAIRHSDRQERWWWLRPMYRFPELGRSDCCRLPLLGNLAESISRTGAQHHAVRQNDACTLPLTYMVAAFGTFLLSRAVAETL